MSLGAGLGCGGTGAGSNSPPTGVTGVPVGQSGMLPHTGVPGDHHESAWHPAIPPAPRHPAPGIPGISRRMLWALWQLNWAESPHNWDSPELQTALQRCRGTAQSSAWDQSSWDQASIFGASSPGITHAVSLARATTFSVETSSSFHSSTCSSSPSSPLGSSRPSAVMLGKLPCAASVAEASGKGR